MKEQPTPFKFSGFQPPAQNYSKLPHSFVEALPVIDSMAELKVVIYLLRHTWGFSEYGKPKRITLDEFMNGRKRRDGSRIDQGTGLSNKSVITGLESAVSHSFVLVEVDYSDKARIQKFYSLKMDTEVKIFNPDVKDLHTRDVKLTHRSEKETLERKEREISDDFRTVTQILSTLTGGSLNTSTADLIKTWLDNHTAEWVQKAIKVAMDKGARSAAYVDKVLISWEANGYPKSREEKIREVKSKGKPEQFDAHKETPEEFQRRLAIAATLVEKPHE